MKHLFIIKVAFFRVLLSMCICEFVHSRQELCSNARARARSLASPVVFISLTFSACGAAESFYSLTHALHLTGDPLPPPLSLLGNHIFEVSVHW